MTKKNPLYRNNLKNRQFDQEAPQVSHSERATIADRLRTLENSPVDCFLGKQVNAVNRPDASENEKSEAKTTQSKANSSGCSGMQGRSLVSIADLSKEEILLILRKAEEMKKKAPKDVLKGKILASCFFEPSTRTRLCFESAMIRLGGNVIGFSDAAVTSAKKGESLSDAMRCMGLYADLLVVRHPCEGAARVASLAAGRPVINAGDGANQHPSQTLLDLYTMKETQGKLKGLNVALVGDLKYGRTVHSLCLASAHFDMRLFFVSTEELSLPEEISSALKKQGIKFSFHRTIEDVLGKADILYMTRVQKERFEPTMICSNTHILTKEMLAKAKKNLKVLHPLPRVDEIEIDVDETPHAGYFEQAENGLYVRMALLSLILG